MSQQKQGLNEHPYRVDIYVHPPVVPAKSGSVIAIGDMHGNAMKLISSLIYHGAASGLTEEEYHDLATIYKMPVENLTEEDLDRFDELVGKMTFKQDIRYILMGDELADRGNNDYFTLKVIEAMDKKNMNFDILQSNHGAAFLQGFESKDIDFSETGLGDQSISSMRLKLLTTGIDGNPPLRTKESVSSMIKNSHQKHVKLIDYQEFIDENGTKGLVFYTHAPYSIDMMIKLAPKLGIVVNEDDLKTVEGITALIDKINGGYQQKLKEGKGSELFLQNEENKLFDGKGKKFSENDVALPLIWSRRVDVDLQKDPEFNGIPVRWRVGHIGDDDISDKNPHAGNLDKNNNLGKGATDNRGEYRYDLVDPFVPASLKYSDERNIPIKSDPTQEQTLKKLMDYKYITPPPKKIIIKMDDPKWNLYQKLEQIKAVLKEHALELDNSSFYKTGKQEKKALIEALVDEVDGIFLQEFGTSALGVTSQVKVDKAKLAAFIDKYEKVDNIKGFQKSWRNDPISQFFRAITDVLRKEFGFQKSETESEKKVKALKDDLKGLRESIKPEEIKAEAVSHQSKPQ